MNETLTTPQSILRRIVDELHMSVRAFALGMNEPYSKIFDIYNGRTKVIVPSVQRSITEHYGVDANFLRTGKGGVFANQNQVPTTSDDLTNSFLKVISVLSEDNARPKARIEELERERISESLPPTQNGENTIC